MPTSFCCHAYLIHLPNSVCLAYLILLPCLPHSTLTLCCRVPQPAHPGGGGGDVHSEPPADKAAEECRSALDHTPPWGHCVSHGDPVQVSCDACVYAFHHLIILPPLFSLPSPSLPLPFPPFLPPSPLSSLPSSLPLSLPPSSLPSSLPPSLPPSLHFTACVK